MYKHILIHLIGIEKKNFPVGKHFSAGSNVKRLYHIRVLSNLRVIQRAVPRSKVDNYKLIST